MSQDVVPVDERNVFYLYQQFGIANEPRMKVLVISSYIYRNKYNENILESVQVALELAFSKKTNQIRENEYNQEVPSSYQVYENASQELNFAFVSHGIAQASGPETYLTLSSSTELLVKSREKLLQDFIRDGYTIFQVDFDDLIPGDLKLEKVEKLSALWIPTYRKGDILSIAKRYQKSSETEESAGITVEDKKKDKSTSATKDDRDWAAIANAKRYEAGLYESEGDRLMKLGELSKAAEQYRAAQAALPTDRVQQKLNNAESTLQNSAAVIGGGLDFTQDVSVAFDEMKIPKFSGWGITHSALAPDDRNKGVSPDLVPSTTTLTYGGYRILAMEIGFSYVRSPVYSMFLTNSEGQKINQTIQVNRSTFGPAASFGLSIPFKHFVVYGMFGWNVSLWTTGANLLTEGYTYKDIQKDMETITFEPKTDVGIKIKVPGTRLGIGAHYVMNKFIGKNIKLKDNGYSVISKGSNQYYVGGSEKESYKYDVIGLSLYLLIRK